MNYLIKGWKYLLFVDIRKVGYLVDNLQFDFILFIYNASFILSSKSFNQENVILVQPFFSQNLLMIRFGET